LYIHLCVVGLWSRVMCVKQFVTVPKVTFAYVFDAGPIRVRKYDSAIIGLGISVEVVSEEQKASLLDSRPCS